MACKIPTMKIRKSCDISYFSPLYTGKWREKEGGVGDDQKPVADKTPHAVQIKVDDQCWVVNNMVLAWWSNEYINLMDKDNIILLDEFTGQKNQVKDCIDLIHGEHILGCDSDTTIVLARFGDKFKIPELMDEVVNWFKWRLIPDHLIESIYRFSQINQLKLSISNQLNDSLKCYLLQNSESCYEILQVLPDLDSYLLDLLLEDVALFKLYINLIKQKISKESECEKIVNKFEKISERDPAILTNIVSEMRELVDVISQIAETRYFMKRFMNIMNTLLKLSHSQQQQILAKFQNWRKMSKSELLTLKEQLEEFEFVFVLSDWVEHTTPTAADVIELYNTIKQEDVEYECMKDLRDKLCYYPKNKLEMQPVVKLQTYKYEGAYLINFIESDRLLLMKCVKESGSMSIAFPCTVENCKFKKDTPLHVVTLCFHIDIANDKLDIKMLQTKNLRPGEHSHYKSHVYKNWVILCDKRNFLTPMFSYFKPEYKTIFPLPLITKSHSEIVAVLDTASISGLSCLMLKK